MPLLVFIPVAKKHLNDYRTVVLTSVDIKVLDCCVLAHHKSITGAVLGPLLLAFTANSSTGSRKLGSAPCVGTPGLSRQLRLNLVRGLMQWFQHHPAIGPRAPPLTLAGS